MGSIISMGVADAGCGAQEDDSWAGLSPAPTHDGKMSYGAPGFVGGGEIVRGLPAPMCVRNQEYIRYALDGLCQSPEEFPAKWASMIFGYFDESGEPGPGYFVVSGFVGKRKDWQTYSRLWKEAKGSFGPLHLAKMRLGSKVAPQRYGDLLLRLGSIPQQANLQAFAGSVRTSDYVSKVQGTIAEITMAGYNVALVSLLNAVLESHKIPKRERVEFIFEDQFEFAELRAQNFRKFRKLDRYKTHHGLSRIGEDKSMAKDELLEASDYLSYAILQQLIDPESQKSKLTEPILKSAKTEHTQITEEDSAELLKVVFGDDLSQIPKMDRLKKRFIRSKIANYAG
jgi:hypothetical protein